MLTGVHTPVFCISEIPETTLDYFLQCIDNIIQEHHQRFSGFDERTVSDEVVFITTKAVSKITSGARRPARAFHSPFIGESVERIRDWFVNNIVPRERGYLANSFLVMDSRTVRDNTCLLVCVLDKGNGNESGSESESDDGDGDRDQEKDDYDHDHDHCDHDDSCRSSRLQTVRCDFEEGHLQTGLLEFGNEGMRDGTRDLFMDTGEVMTRELYELAIDGRLYIENGKLVIKNLS